MRLNRGMTLEDVARAVKVFGYRWTTARVVEIENGQRAMTLATLIALAGTFECALVDLVPPGERLQMGREYAARSDAIRDALRGGSVGEWSVRDIGPNWLRKTDAELVEDDKSQGAALAVTWEKAMGRHRRFGVKRVTLGQQIEIRRESGLAERRAAQRLGISLEDLVLLSADMWSSTLTQERDRRAGDNTSAQARGRVTRELLAELQARIEKADGDG